MIEIKDAFLLVSTKNTKLVFEVKDFYDPSTPFYKNKRFLTLFFYGLNASCPTLEKTPRIKSYGSNEDFIFDKLISSTYGNGNQKEPLLLLTNSDGTNVNRFFFKEARVLKGPKEIVGPHTRDVLETLEIIEVDEPANLELHHYFSIVEDSDVIISKKELINKGDKNIDIKRLFSLELPLSTDSLTVETFDGAWLYERSRHVSNVESGVFSIESKSGGSSHRHNPYFQLIDNHNPDVIYGFNLIYSGNHKEQVEINPLEYSSVMVGINDFGFSFCLEKNQSFITPEAIFVIKRNKDELTTEMHSFAKKHVINPSFQNKDRPILFNNWEGTGMNIDEKSLLEMAVIAKKTGVEQFVVDDGWFKNRITDDGGLGDWEVDLGKFPNGLKPFVDKVRSLGLKFGIWVEPEMICINSDLYKAHPEFASLIPNREPLERRHQLMIDMTNKEVIDYLFDCLTKVFDEIKPDYVKWDYNRWHTDIYSPAGTKTGEYLYKSMYGTYDLLERLIKRYPNTLFEGCSSGGGRFDLGALYYTPQIWGSDDTNTYCRSFIMTGTLTAYPTFTIGAHVSRDGDPDANRGARSSLEDRFNLNCFGAFGYEFDFRTFGQTELDILAKQISFYKEHRRLLQNGSYFVNRNVFDDNTYLSFNLVNDDQSEAMLLCEQTTFDAPLIKWTVKGLKENASYEVLSREQYNLKEQFHKIYSGKELACEGIELGSLSSTTDAHLYKNGVFTRLLYIKEIK